MTKKIFVLAGFSILLLSACTKQEQQAAMDALTNDGGSSSSLSDTVDAEMDAWAAQDQATQPSSEAAGERENSPSIIQTSARYAAYTDAALTDGTTKVLFFHASWCPICKIADTELTQWYDAGGIPLTTYKVDYDASVDLKTKYGVTYQHTFVKVDGQGKMIEKIQGPTDAQLKAMLGA